MIKTTEREARGGRFLIDDVPDIFTREDVTDEQRMLADTAAAFVRQDVLPVESRLFAHDWTLTRELLRKAATLDLLGVEVPEAYGGMALSKVSGALIIEQTAVHPSFGASLGVHSNIGTLPLVYFGTETQKAKYLPRLVSGEMVGAYALTEPGSGSDARAARTTAVLSADGQHYILNGQKSWISNGGFADLFTIFAKVDGEHFTAFLVERSMGVVSGAEEKKLGLDGSSTTTLMLDGVKVPVENVLGKIGEGHRVAFNILNLGRVKLGTRNTSAARQALRHAARYAVERRQFGKPIAEFGLIQEKLADMAIRCFACDSMVFRTLGDVDRELDDTDTTAPEAALKVIESFSVECAINKVFTSEALAFIADEAIQVFGGNGYSREFPVERIYRDARITRIYEGTNEINRLLIATRLIKAGIISAEPAARPAPAAGPLTRERATLTTIKSLALATFAAAARAYGNALRDEQEILARLANVAIEAYAVESVIGRMQKQTVGTERTALMIAMAEVFVADSVNRTLTAAGSIAASLGAPHNADVQPLIRSLQTAEAVDTIARRRQIARAVIAAGGALH